MQARCIGIVLFLLLFWGGFSSVSAENTPRFTENKGQLPEQVAFKIRVANSDIYFEKNRLVFNIYNPSLLETHKHSSEHDHAHHEELAGHAYHMRFVGASEMARVESIGSPYPDYENFIKGSYAVGHVQSYYQVAYRHIYPGIDLEYFGRDGNLKYDVRVAAGADVSALKMQYDGASTVALKNGNLIVTNVFNSVEESIPLAYQVINGKQQVVPCQYALDGATVSFVFPDGYDESKELIIDPTLVFSSYTGSTANNLGFTATYDNDGALYGAGIAFGIGYPTVVGSYSTTFNGGSIDMGISKFSADGSSLVYSTYLGGDNTEAPQSMIVNSQGQLIVLGSTSSFDFPMGVSAYDNTFNGGISVYYVSNGTDFQNGSDIVIAVLSADGASLIGSTFFGGSLNDGLNANTTLSYNYGDLFRGEVVVDDADNIYITSSTLSSDFPTTPGAISATLNGTQDAICAKFNPDLSNLFWSTYLGGNGADAGYSLKLNATGDVYVTGGTEGQNFPIVGNTLNTSYLGGSADGYIARISNDGTTLLGSSYIGTPAYDQSFFVEVDGNDDVYLYGQSEGNYTVTGGVYSNTNGKQFIQKLSPDLATSIYSTVFGSGSAEVNISPTAFMVDVCQRVFISGWGGGTNNFWNAATGNTIGMPTTPNGYQLTTDGSDFYFMVLDADASSLLYGTYLGGDGIEEHVDGGTSRFNSDAIIYQAVCAGCFYSDAFPTTPGVVSNVNGSSCNLGVIKLDMEIPDVMVEISNASELQGCVPFDVTFTAGQIIATDYMWYFADGDSSQQLNPTHTYTQPGTYEVMLVGTNTHCIGDEFTDTAFVTITAILSTDTVDAGSDQTICVGDSAQLNATGGVSFVWSPTTSLSNPSSANPIATPSATTAYIVETTNAQGCTSTDTVIVHVNATQFAISADTTICIGDTIQISAAGGTNYNWSPNLEISNTASASPLVYPSAARYYVVDATDANGCQYTDSVLVSVQNLPTAFAGFNQGVCAGSTVQLNATGGTTYQWTPTIGLNNPNVANPIVTLSADTATYVVSVSDALGCVNTDTVTVWQEPLPVVQAGPDTTVCEGQSVQLFASGGQAYQWTPATGLSNPNSPNPTATPLTTTTYTVTAGQPTGNLVFNGDFSAGNVGFSSDYSYASQLNPQGLYSIVTDASAVHPAFEGSGHTGNAPQDSFLVVNGSDIPNQNVWCQTVSVSPNTEYYFGAWVSTVVANNPAVLQFSINGQVLGAPFTAPFNTNNWTQFYETWNSGTATTATICVVNQNTLPTGNDFALDDISFSTYCTNSAQVMVTVNPAPVANAGPDQAICIGETTQMAGSGGATYQWVPPVGLDDATSPNTLVQTQVSRTYTLLVQDNIGCQAMDEMTLTVNPLPLANAGPDYEVCAGESVVLQGSGGVIYTWTPATGLDNPSIQLPVATPSSSTTYTLTVTDSNQCQATDTTTVLVHMLPLVDAGPDSMICQNGSLVLQANGALTYAWSPLVGLSDPQSATPTASPIDATTYYVVGTDANGCVQSDSVQVTVFAVAPHAGNYIICEGDSVQATVSGGATYNWQPSQNVSNPSSSSPMLSPTASTQYTVLVTSATGCLAQTQVNVDVLTVPQAEFEASFEPSCDGIFASFDNQSLFAASYFWSFGDGATSTHAQPTHQYEAGPGHTVTLIAYNHDSLCVDSLVLDYTGQWYGNDTIAVQYANVFTPNHDGINDCFKPEVDGRFSDCYAFKVFNRWGELLFESVAGQNHCWDGRTKGGRMVPEGTYYYISEVHNINHAGYVTVVYE